MRILADQNIPFAKQAFAHFGDVSTFVGRELTAQDVRNAEILLVRSVTKVNAALLEASSVRFVASATIGTDHIDLKYLQQRNIAFANAPGSNATSAAEYVLAALLYFAQQQQVALAQFRFGIVGYGNVGSRVARLFRALGLQCEIYDPPRQQLVNDIDYCDWETICACDVITAHVPLTKTGEYPTHKMFNRDFFNSLKSGALFINTARGGAVDETALHERLQSNKTLHLVLDVWANEPRIDHDLLKATILGTPHIAGYAYDGKLRGTEMIYQAACKHFNAEPQWTMQSVLQDVRTCISPVVQGNWLATLHQLIKKAYDIEQDDSALRKILTMDSEQAAQHFDALRKNYPKRREFSHFDVDAATLTEQQQSLLKEVGFGLYRR